MQTYAKDIMSTKILCVGQNTTVEEALKILVNSGITGVPVVDQAGKMIGVFSDYDVIMQLNKSKKLEAMIFREPITFTRKVEAVDEKMPLPKIMDIFVKSRFRRLPVVSKNGKLIGIITRRDLMKLFFYQAALT